MRGLEAPDRTPVAGDDFRGGNICYHLRNGSHFFSRRDWLVYMNIIKSDIEEKRKIEG